MEVDLGFVDIKEVLEGGEMFVCFGSDVFLFLGMDSLLGEELWFVIVGVDVFVVLDSKWGVKFDGFVDV